MESSSNKSIGNCTEWANLNADTNIHFYMKNKEYLEEPRDLRIWDFFFRYPGFPMHPVLCRPLGNVSRSLIFRLLSCGNLLKSSCFQNPTGRLVSGLSPESTMHPFPEYKILLFIKFRSQKTYYNFVKLL